MNTPEKILNFLKHCVDTIKAQSNDSVILEGSKVLSNRIKIAKTKQFQAELLPVLDNLDAIAETPYTYNFHRISKEMVWKPSPRTDDKGEQMALGIFNELFDLGDLIAGLLIIDKYSSYPLHQHQPQELYLILSGEANWCFGGADNFTKLIPGDVIYNHPNDIHGVNTHNEPVLALFVLWN